MMTWTRGIVDEMKGRTGMSQDQRVTDTMLILLGIEPVPGEA